MDIDIIWSVTFQIVVRVREAQYEIRGVQIDFNHSYCCVYKYIWKTFCEWTGQEKAATLLVLLPKGRRWVKERIKTERQLTEGVSSCWNHKSITSLKKKNIWYEYSCFFCFVFFCFTLKCHCVIRISYVSCCLLWDSRVCRTLTLLYDSIWVKIKRRFL